jgi:hypothetical protein
MKNSNIHKLVAKLMTDFPNFVKNIGPNAAYPYIVFGELGIYIRDLIDTNTTDNFELSSIFNFLNQMGESSEEEVHNLLTVGVLEILIDSKKAFAFAQENLKNGALKDLQLIQSFWCEN